MTLQKTYKISPLVKAESCIVEKDNTPYIAYSEVYLQSNCKYVHIFVHMSSKQAIHVKGVIQDMEFSENLFLNSVVECK